MDETRLKELTFYLKSAESVFWVPYCKQYHQGWYYSRVGGAMWQYLGHTAGAAVASLTPMLAPRISRVRAIIEQCDALPG